MESNLISGKVPSGQSCFASQICEFKEMACNGEGCQVSDGKTSERDVSCGMARLFEITHSAKG